MHLQEIVLQGFKSYTTTVKITDFTKFTAITGLNGTGKSNIIDGIIFCLNLDTNKTLRIKKLEDLINTNCNEATVILKFNNCTISRTINREGKSKIHINNTLSTTKTLKKLLNQNNIQKNAQNVILQGNITKILNLTKNNYLVQETANIRVYMQEKEEALELIKKKEDKLIDTKETLKKRAEPYIGKLRSERGIYMEMKRCEEMKNKNMQTVEQNTGLLDENENNKKMLDLQQLMKDYEDKMIELEKLKSNDEKVTSVDYKQVYEMRNKIEEIKRNLNIVNVKIEQTNDNKTFDNKENVEVKKRKKGEKEREAVDLDELKGQIADLKEKERILINEIRNKEAENIGLGKENISDKLDNINKLKNERNMANSKLEEIKESHPLFSIGDDEKLKTMHQKYTKDLADIEQNKISINDLNIVKSKYSKQLSGINYPIMSGVYGTIADNFVVKDNRHKEIIDIILGARRKYVIVDDEKIGAQILRNTRQRVNIIPLNKIRPNVDSRKEKIISQNMGENCMKLIDFEPKMKKALEYIFGNYYVFEDSSQAKKMCYKEKVPCISMDGNLYDPRGIVTGGVKKRYNDEQPLFKEILQTKQILNDLESKNYAYNNSQKECSNMQNFLSRYDAYRHLVSKIASLDDKIAMHQKFLSQNMDLKKELQNVKKTLNAKELVYNDEIEREKMKDELEKQKKENEREREALIGTKKELEKDLADLNKQVQCVEIENERLSIYEKDKTICEDKVQFLSIAVAKLKKNINKLLDSIKTDEPQNEQKSSSEYPSYFSDLNTKIFALMPKLQDNIEILPSQEEEDCKLELLKAKSDLEVLTKTKRRTMDPHNYEFLEKNEELLRFLEEKISKLENDKLKLISKISDLNKQSELELENAHKHLNAEAGKYLRLFLPDSDIRLDNDYNISVKITNWKNSVNELSGGQRSLVALSFIFAMLSYKPAPFYLFDEVDSALDISMTKNIGMCMKRFKEAQFIVVSLKEEFYKNASSIYQVYLSEGKTNVKKIK